MADDRGFAISRSWKRFLQCWCGLLCRSAPPAANHVDSACASNMWAGVRVLRPAAPAPNPGLPYEQSHHHHHHHFRYHHHAVPSTSLPLFDYSAFVHDFDFESSAKLRASLQGSWRDRCRSARGLHVHRVQVAQDDGGLKVRKFGG